MNLQKLKESAPPIRKHIEMQFIVEGKNGGQPELLTGCYGLGHSGIQVINHQKVLSSRAYRMDWYDR